MTTQSSRLTAHSTHDFIQYKKGTILPANGFHGSEVALWCRDHTRRSRNGFGDDYEKNICAQRVACCKDIGHLHPMTVFGPSSRNLSSSSWRSLSTYCSSVSSARWKRLALAGDTL